MFLRFALPFDVRFLVHRPPFKRDWAILHIRFDYPTYLGSQLTFLFRDQPRNRHLLRVATLTARVNARRRFDDCERTVASRVRNPELRRHGSLCQFVVEGAGLVLTIALAPGFFFRRCILAVVTAVLLMFRNRTMAFRICTLLSVYHSGSPLTKRMGCRFRFGCLPPVTRAEQSSCVA